MWDVALKQARDSCKLPLAVLSEVARRIEANQRPLNISKHSPSLLNARYWQHCRLIGMRYLGGNVDRWCLCMEWFLLCKLWEAVGGGVVVRGPTSLLWALCSEKYVLWGWHSRCPSTWHESQPVNKIVHISRGDSQNSCTWVCNTCLLSLSQAPASSSLAATIACPGLLLRPWCSSEDMI